MKDKKKLKPNQYTKQLCNNHPWLSNVEYENDLIRKVWDKFPYYKASTIIRLAYNMRKKIEKKRNTKEVKEARLKFSNYRQKAQSVI
jgi:hypothetical protein